MSKVLYTLTKDLFYESPEAYQCDPAVRRILCKIVPNNWHLRPHGIWLFAEPPCRNLPKRGKKIHVSTRPETREIVLQKTAAIAVEYHTTFKCFADFHLWDILHDKPYAAERKGAYGKAITLYPQTNEVFTQLAEKLSIEFENYSGPDLITDQPIPNSKTVFSKTVFYRYGGFLALDEDTEEDAEEIDDTPDLILPSEDLEDLTDETLHPIDHYEFLDALHISAAGGVYRAENKTTGETCIIKEASEDTCVTADGTDAVDRLKSEQRILQKLSADFNLNFVPKPIESFSLWRSVFVVMERLPGETLIEITQKPLSLKTRLHIAASVADAIATLHDEHQIIWGDIAPDNVLYASDTHQIYLVDFELAASVLSPSPVEAVSKPTGTDPEAENAQNPVAGTPGFTANIYAPKTVESEVYTLGRLLLWLFAPVNEIYPLDATASSRFVKALEASLPTKIVEILKNCLNPETPTTTRHIADTLKQIQIKTHDSVITDSAKTPKIPIRQYTENFDAIIACFKSHLTFDRQDRLFPCSPEGFTAPLSMAYGAAGVATLLKTIGEDALAEKTLDWILAHPDISDEQKLASTPGYWRGTAGIATTLGRLGDTHTARKYFQIAEKHVSNFEFSQYDGIAGVAHAALNLYTQTAEAYYLDTAVNLADELISQSVAPEDTDDVTRIWKHPDDDALRPGFLFGVAGVAAFLFQLADELDTNGSRHYTDIGEPALLWVEKHTVLAEDGHLATPTDIGANTYARNFAHGTAGVAKAFLLARQYFGTDKDSFIRNLLLPPSHPSMPEFTNTPAPGCFYGLSGIGEVRLDAYATLGEKAYHTQAHQILKEILCFQVPVKGKGLGFPGGETLTRLSCDYATGSLGIAHFIHRFLTATDQRR